MDIETFSPIRRFRFILAHLAISEQLLLKTWNIIHMKRDNSIDLYVKIYSVWYINSNLHNTSSNNSIY